MFTKEKNLLTFTVKTKNHPKGIDYQFDFNTNKTIDLMKEEECKKPIGVIKALKEYAGENNSLNSPEYHFCIALLRFYQKPEEYSFLPSMIEKIIAMNKIMDFAVYNLHQLQFINNNLKYLPGFPGKYISLLDLEEYIFSENIKKINNLWAELNEEEQKIFVQFFKRSNICDPETIKLYINIYVKSYLGEFFSHSATAIDYLSRYMDFCKFINHKPKHKNFMRDFIETRRTYVLYKQQKDDEKFQENYNKHALAWKFEYGDFCVIAPQKSVDLIKEGQKMHHCVGSYIDKVVKNQTYICFVRNKENPEQPYITCEIHPDGQINQYFLAYDKYISEKEDKDFKQKYQEYLNLIWQKD